MLGVHKSWALATCSHVQKPATSILVARCKQPQDTGISKTEAPTPKQVDEDGFELVTYKRKARDLGSDNKVEAPVKKKKKELVDFYRFQVRDKRREELASLRKRCVFSPSNRTVSPENLPQPVFCWLHCFASIDETNPCFAALNLVTSCALRATLQVRQRQGSCCRDEEAAQVQALLSFWPLSSNLAGSVV